jgi:hypothetical protein
VVPSLQYGQPARKDLNELEIVFAEVSRLRDAGRLDNLTMGELAQDLTAPEPLIKSDSNSILTACYDILTSP